MIATGTSCSGFFLFALTDSIADWIACAGMLISVWAALGLAMVSMSAAVSPKSVWNEIGAAPCGSWLFSAFSLRLMSLDCLLTVVVFLASWAWMYAGPGR